MHSTSYSSWGRLLLALALTVGGTTAQAQLYLPPASSSTDGPPVYATPAPIAPGTQEEVAHTGTDVMRLPGSKNNMQVMVWDHKVGNQTSVTLSWSQFPTGSSVVVPGTSGAVLLTSPGGNISDPDVTMAFYNGNLYADVVYLSDIGGANRTYWAVYQWNGLGFGLINTQMLGSGNQLPNVLGFQPDPVLRVHSAPNIDANAAGNVAIAWQESSVETAQITVVSASYPPPGYTYTATSLVFAEGYFLTGNITGTLDCNNRGYLVSRNYEANTAGTNPPILANQTLLPDVAVAPDNKVWVTYINSSATQGQPPVTAGINLVVKLFSIDRCSIRGLSDMTKAFAINDVTNAPRIAATPNIYSPRDVEVVRAQTNPGGCFTGTTYNIFNYGYVMAKNGYHGIRTVNAEINSLWATEPVVAFNGGDSDGKTAKYTDQYLVSWAGQDYEKSGGLDVWARALQAGFIVGTGDYSRVNTNADGDQRYPSIAARYLWDSKSSAHLFANLAKSDLGYKLTPAAVGTPLTRAAAPASSPVAEPTDAPVQAFPNPFSQAVQFKLHLAPQETVQRLQVTDLSGRVVDTLTPPAEGEQNVTWQPKQGLPKGAYMVRVVTDKRTQTISLSKE